MAALQRMDRALDFAVVVAAVATIPLTILAEEGISTPLLVAADWLVWAVFALDYLLHLSLAEKRWRYVRSNWLGLAVVVLSFPATPALLNVVRLARLARVGRLSIVVARGIGGIRLVLGRRGLPYVLMVTAFIVGAAGALLTLVEPEKAPAGFWDGVWWAVVTVTTVGYGDISPATLGGRLIASVLMLTGIGLTATLAAAIAAHFVGQEQGSDIQALERRLERIESQLDELLERGGRQSGAEAEPDDRGPAAER